jgi:hypothetical protein
MKQTEFENILLNMSKPQIEELKHQDMLEHTIIKARDTSLLSWWWLSIPLYVIAAFCMKSFFMPGATLSTSIHEFSNKQHYLSILLFIIVPIAFILLNILSILKVYCVFGGVSRLKVIEETWFNLLMIVLSLLILITYLI